jgi:hypothetical protein
VKFRRTYGIQIKNSATRHNHKDPTKYEMQESKDCAYGGRQHDLQGNRKAFPTRIITGIGKVVPMLN